MPPRDTSCDDSSSVGKKTGCLAENPAGLLGWTGNRNLGLVQGSKSNFVRQRQRQHLTCATEGGVKGDGAHEGVQTELVERKSVGLPSPGDGDGDGNDDGDGDGCDGDGDCDDDGDSNGDNSNSS